MSSVIEQPPDNGRGSSVTAAAVSSLSHFIKQPEFWLIIIIGIAVWFFQDLSSNVKDIQNKMASKEEVSVIHDDIELLIKTHTGYINKRIDELSEDISKKHNETGTELKSIHDDIRKVLSSKSTPNQ